MSDNTNIRQATLRGVKWTAINAFSNKFVTFFLGVILARLLSPSDYGVVGMTAVFFAFAGVLIDSGLCTSLVRKKEITDIDSSTIFYFNIVVSFILFLLFCVFSSQIANFLGQPVLTNIVKVSAFSMFVGSFGSVQWSLCTKDVNFKTPALIRFPVNVGAGLIGVALAYCGLGPWAIVLQNFTAVLASTIAIWCVSRWRPKITFSFAILKQHIKFGGNLALNSIMDRFTLEGMGMLIGKFYTPAQLGYYTKGQDTSQIPTTLFYGTVAGVMFPVMSKMQDDRERLMAATRKAIRVLSLIIFFVMFLLIAVARPLVLFLYAERWEPAVVYLQIFCLTYMWLHIHGTNWNLLIVSGHTDIGLKKQIVVQITNFLYIACALPFGPLWMCIATAWSSVSTYFINSYIANKLFDYGFWKQGRDFFPYMLKAAIACTPAFFVSYLDLPNLLLIIIGASMSSVIYFGYLYLKHDENLFEFISLTPLKNYVHVK